MPSSIGFSPGIFNSPSDLVSNLSLGIYGFDSISEKQLHETLPWDWDEYYPDVTVSQWTRPLGDDRIHVTTTVSRQGSSDGSSDHSYSFQCQLPQGQRPPLSQTVKLINGQARRVLFRKLEVINGKDNQLFGKSLPNVLKADIITNCGIRYPLGRSRKNDGVPSILLIDDKDGAQLSLRNAAEKPLTVAVIEWSHALKDADLHRFKGRQAVVEIPAKGKLSTPFNLCDLEGEGTRHHVMFLVGESGAFDQAWVEKFVAKLSLEGASQKLPELPSGKRWGVMTTQVKYTNLMPEVDHGMEELD